YLERAIAHFETSDENLHSHFGSHFRDFRYSLVVQFSKIKLVVSVAYRVTSNSYNISHPTDQCKLFFQLLVRARR
ncbi:hypothetical protein, partial [Paenibacillus tritici]|uniref:hypothetical protein n=1 Tax=Paenibacillus tritici TaxID=1873425 RepID=UPI001C201D0D